MAWEWIVRKRCERVLSACSWLFTHGLAGVVTYENGRVMGRLHALCYFYHGYYQPRAGLEMVTYYINEQHINSYESWRDCTVMH